MGRRRPTSFGSGHAGFGHLDILGNGIPAPGICADIRLYQTSNMVGSGQPQLLHAPDFDAVLEQTDRLQSLADELAAMLEPD